MNYEGRNQPTQHGIQRHQAYWQDDFEADFAADGKVTATHSFRCHLDDALTLIPQGRDAHCIEPGFEGLGLESAKIKNIGGKIAEVICIFVGGGNTEGDYGFDEVGGKQTSLSVSTSEVPLEEHPRYRDLFKDKLSADTEKLLSFKNGRVKLGEYREDDADIQVIYRDTNNNVLGWTVQKDSLEYEIATFFSQGVTHYLASTQTLRISYVQKHKPSEKEMLLVGYRVPNSSGRIPDEYKIKGRNYLFAGFDIQKEGHVYTVTETYIMSGFGGWIPELYDYDEVNAKKK